MSRGHKICKQCGTITGPRTYICKQCGTSFEIKGQQGSVIVSNKPIKKPIKTHKPNRVHKVMVDWRTLLPGDYIKSLSGSGPVWLTRDGQWEPLGYAGRFKVHALDKEGIHAYPMDRRNSGHCFIYMGPYTRRYDGLYKRPHKIIKIKMKKDVDNDNV